MVLDLISDFLSRKKNEYVINDKNSMLILVSGVAFDLHYLYSGVATAKNLPQSGRKQLIT